MSSLSVKIDLSGLEHGLHLIEGIAKAPKYELMDGIGRLVQEQTRYRIESEKTSPAGEAWKPNAQGSSILFQSGALAQSIDYAAADTSVEVGSGIIYARIHQEGGKIVPKNGNALVFMMGNHLVQVKSVTMPARPFIGLSAANQNDILEAVTDWVGRLLQ